MTFHLTIDRFLPDRARAQESTVMAAEQGAPLPTPEVSDADWADWLIATQPGELLDLPQAAAAHAPASA